MYAVQRTSVMAQEFCVYIYTHTYRNLIQFKAVFLLKLQAAVASNIMLYSFFSTSLQGNWNLFVRSVSAMGPPGVYAFNRG